MPACNAPNGGAEVFAFAAVPADAAQLMALPQASLDTPFKTAALVMLSLLAYEQSPEACFAMLNALRGPAPMSEYDKQFLRDRLRGKAYKARSFFAGAAPGNGYTPSQPLTVEIFTNPYSFAEENWATMFIRSAGADSPRQIKLRRKPSTGQWFLTEIQCLGDIREPAADDPWA